MKCMVSNIGTVGEKFLAVKKNKPKDNKRAKIWNREFQKSGKSQSFWNSHENDTYLTRKGEVNKQSIR